jgi:hypothetical protein
VLIALVTAMFLAGGGATYDLFGKDAQKAIVSVLEDTEQEKQVKALMKQGAKSGQKDAKELAKLMKSWLKADLDPASGRAEFDQMFAEAQSLRSEAQESFLDVVFAIQEKVTAEQWEAAFSKALDGEE